MRRTMTVVLVLLLLSTACGDDDSLTVEEYFAELETAGIEFTARGEAVEAKLVDTQDPVAAAKQSVPEFATIYGDFLDELKGIAPPEEVAEAHQSMIDAGDETVAALDEAADSIEAIDDPAAVAEFFDGPLVLAFGEAAERFKESCLALQGIADDDAIEVDLHCGS